MKTKILISVMTLLLTVSCGVEKGIDTFKKDSMASQKTSEDLLPVSIYKEGVTSEMSRKYRNEYQAKNFISADDAGAYGFLNLSEVSNTGIVYRDGQVAILNENRDEEIKTTMTNTNAGNMTLEDLLKDEVARMQGVLIIHDGEIVYEAYPGMKRTDKHLWFSASKPLTGLLAHIVEEEGLLDLEENVTHYLPEYASFGWQLVKVKHLLHHMSGMDYVENNDNMKNPEHPLALGFAYAIATRNEASDMSMFDIIKDVRLYKEPGLAFDYSTMNTEVLGMIIERVTGQKFEDALSERVWARMGMESEGMYALTPYGETLNGAIFASRLRDMGRFGMLFTPSWNEVSETQLVSDSYFDKLYEDTYSEAYMRGAQGRANADYFNEIPSHASYQWDAVFEDGDLYKAGRYGQGIYVSPTTNTVVVWFSSVYENLLYFPGFARQLVHTHYK